MAWYDSVGQALAHANWEQVGVKLSGLVGGIVSMHYLKGTRTERAFMALSGFALSYYTAPYVSRISGLPEGGAGFLLGLFGMAMVSITWAWLQSAPVGVWVNRAVEAWLSMWLAVWARVGKGGKKGDGQ